LAKFVNLNKSWNIWLVKLSSCDHFMWSLEIGERITLILLHWVRSQGCRNSPLSSSFPLTRAIRSWIQQIILDILFIPDQIPKIPLKMEDSGMKITLHLKFKQIIHNVILKIHLQVAVNVKCSEAQMQFANKYRMDDVFRLTGRHFQRRLLAATGKVIQRRCRVCFWKDKKRKDTTYYCPSCPSEPPLCLGDCFEIYHTVQKFWFKGELKKLFCFQIFWEGATIIEVTFRDYSEVFNSGLHCVLKYFSQIEDFQSKYIPVEEN
jgi:hypothetical protein